jgi:hypothetical protein
MECEFRVELHFTLSESILFLYVGGSAGREILEEEGGVPLIPSSTML